MNEKIEIDKVEFDVIVKMLKMTYSFELWNKLIDLSEALYIRVKNICEIDPKLKEKVIHNLHIQRPLVYYYGYSLLMKGLACKKLKRYDEAQQCIEQYSDLSWFANLDCEGQKEVNYYHFIAAANTFEIDLLSGEADVLDKYVSFLEEHPEEKLPGIITIIEAANNHDLNIDSVLTTFADDISKFEEFNEQGIISTGYFNTFLFGLTKYKMKHSDFTAAIDLDLQLLKFSNKMENDGVFKQAVVFFEILRAHATIPQLESFQSCLISSLKIETN